MNDLIKRLRARTVPNWGHATGGTPHMYGHKPDPLCHEAVAEIERLRARVLDLEAVHEDASGAILHERERLRVLVENVRDANAAALRAGDSWHLSTEAQGQAWIRLMDALREAE